MIICLECPPPRKKTTDKQANTKQYNTIKWHLSKKNNHPFSIPVSSASLLVFFLCYPSFSFASELSSDPHPPHPTQPSSPHTHPPPVFLLKVKATILILEHCLSGVTECSWLNVETPVWRENKCWLVLRVEVSEVSFNRIENRNI